MPDTLTRSGNHEKKTIQTYLFMALSAPLNFPSLPPFTSSSCSLELYRVNLSCDQCSTGLRLDFKVSVDFANLLFCLRSSKEFGMLVAGVAGAELLLCDSVKKATSGFSVKKGLKC